MHSQSLSGDGRLEGVSHSEVSREVLGIFRSITSRYWGWVVVLSILTGLGVASMIIRLTDGFDDRSDWGYVAATVAYLTTVFAAAPAVAAGLRFTKNHWRRPMTRIAEIYGVTGILGLLLLLPVLAALPPLEGRNSIWFEWPVFAPFGWDTVSMATLVLAGLVYLWVLALPDLAAARDHLEPSGRQRFIKRLALGWKGNLRQWRVHRWGILILGGFYLMSLPLMMTLISSDLSAGLLPGYKDAIFPAFQALQALQGGVAVVLVTMFILRTAGGYKRYLGEDQFWALSKPLLAFSLLWFYFWWATFLTFWYGRQPSEVNLIQFLMFDAYRIPFLMTFFLSFLLPVSALIWNPVRKSIWGPTLVSVSILIGAFFNQIRMYVSAFSISDSQVTTHLLTDPPGVQAPGVADVLIIIGAISGSALLFLLVSKIIPVISIWEVGEGLPLSKVRQFLNRTVRVIAKSY